MKKILTLFNIILISILTYFIIFNFYVKEFGFFVFLISMSLFGITTGHQQLRSFFIIIAGVFNPIRPIGDLTSFSELIPITVSWKIFIFSLCLGYNIFFLYAIKKGV